MKPYIRQRVVTQNMSPHSPQPAPYLHDSKSAVFLGSHHEQNKKIRETTYHPTHKHNNFDFLRYTIDNRKSPKEHSNHPSTPHARIQRKATDETPKLSTESKEISSWKPIHFHQIQKKNTNPQKKDLSEHKPFVPGNRGHDKRTSNGERFAKDGIYSRDNEQTPIQYKRIFHPSSSKPMEEPKTIPKFGNSYSTSDLVKADNSSNITRQTLSLVRRRRSNLTQLDHFQKIKYLGEGKFGQVCLMRHIKTKMLFALKQIKKSAILQNQMIEQFVMEIKLQLFLNHPNILKLYGVFDDEEHIYLILEYMEDGTLYNQLKKKKTLKQADASRKLKDILEGVSYLHSQQIAHRDIKPENIVISYDLCKICDLGWAALCDDRRKTICGTIDYASPQLLEGKEYGIAIDLWCVGVLCFELIVGKAPFYHISRKQTMKKIIKADLSDISIPQSVPNETKDFIHRLLRKIPEERMSADEALAHPLIQKYLDEEMDDLRASRRRAQKNNIKNL